MTRRARLAALTLIAIAAQAATAHAADTAPAPGLSPTGTPSAEAREHVARQVKDTLAKADGLKRPDNFIEILNTVRTAKLQLALATANPNVHDPQLATLMARIATLSQLPGDAALAAVMLEECLADKPGDPVLAGLLIRATKQSTEVSIKVCKRERDELRKALTDLQSPQSLRIAGLAYAFGHGTLPHIKYGPEFLKKAAEKNDGHALHSLGILADDRSESLDWYLKAYKAGYRVAAHSIAELYAETPDDPDDPLPNDLDKTHLWLRLDFHNGGIRAADRLAQLHQNPDYRNRNPALVLSYLRTAAAEGSPTAREELAKRKTTPRYLGLFLTQPAATLPLQEPDPITLTIAVLHEKSPARNLLLAGDVITAVNGSSFNSTPEFHRLVNASPSPEVTLTITRKGKPLTVKITAATAPLQD